MDMKRWTSLLMAVALLLPAGKAAAQASVPCHFQLGFAALHDALSVNVGGCLDDERYGLNGDSLQHTTGGLLVWRKTDNWTAFTDGYRTWVNGPAGIQQRLNSEHFPFEHDQLGQADLKLRLLEAFGPLLYCDPDYYPVARADEQALAIARFAQIQADTATYQAILIHEHLTDGALSDADKLAVYRDYKQLYALALQSQADGSFAFTAQFGLDRQSGVRVQGSIDGSGAITVLSKQPAPNLNCPICLARGTLIATPEGQVPVEDLRVGMSVWTLDRAGQRVGGVVLQTGSTPVPPTHQMMGLLLADGRQLRASPGHPMIDGRQLGQLHPGDVVDGAVVIHAAAQTYDAGQTYDLLPSGETGFYIADGVPLASTLRTTSK
jgi:hypothetical protein